MPARDIKKELSQLSSLQREVRLLDDQLSRLHERRKKINSSVRTDGAKGSTPYFPYTLHNITITGLSDDELVAKVEIRESIDKVKKKLHKRRAACVKEYNRLNDFIAAVNDSDMRQILTLRYIYHLEWQDIAAKMGPEASEDSVRMAHERFLKKFQ